MENALPKNRPSRCEFVYVSKKNLEPPPPPAPPAVDNHPEEIATRLAVFAREISPAVDKTFVMMKNKQVWFDRNNAALFPKFESGVLRAFDTNNQPAKNYSLMFEEIYFEPMTATEFGRSFLKDSGNPYLGDDGYFKNFPPCRRHNEILTEEINGSGHSHVINTGGQNWWWKDNDKITLVPIHRIHGKNGAPMNYPEAFLYWASRGLIPEDLTAAQEKFFGQFVAAYPKISAYLSFSHKIFFDAEKFKQDVQGGKFKEKIFDYDFSKGAQPQPVTPPPNDNASLIAALKTELLNCDHKRANLQPYEERQLTDINRGHWELFEREKPSDDAEKINLPPGKFFVARPPQLDVRLNGICAIDFGTKSTIVVCRDGDTRMLRIGKGDYSKAPTPEDFENPTVIQLRDLQKFLTAYRARQGRPFTDRNDVTVSHEAAAAVTADNVALSVYNSVFGKLKYWAKDEKNYPWLTDLNGTPQEIKPYVATEAIDASDFDPIELYAYYLGLYINNMYNRIYLDYILSFPVNYTKEVREHLRKSFENGLKKSLPPALLGDEEMMKHFRVYLGASEPAAYAVSALEAFKLEPKEVGEKVAYGVFDFGGGTTDFDFGIESVPENRRRNFIIEQFGSNGDALLGGENILELLAYEVYKDNLDVMREKKIPFALPAGCKMFAGAESLVSRTRDSASHMNNLILAKILRPIWENTDARKNLTEDAQTVKLFLSDKDAPETVTLKIDAAKLDAVIESRIREGVVNFFRSLESAFAEKEISPIHIFLAGNSCRSPFVKKIFDEFIAEAEDGKFILHMPLGMEDKKISFTEKIFQAVSDALLDEEISDDEKFSVAKKLSVQLTELFAEFLARKISDTEKISDAEKLAVQLTELFAEKIFQAVSDESRAKKIFDAFGNILLDEKIFKPLKEVVDAKISDKEKILEQLNKISAAEVMELDKQRTGKTGVAFGLIRCRRGGKDVKIDNRNVDGNDEINFPYFLGDAGTDGKTFTLKIGREVGYGKWTYFTFADEPEFELYYTTKPRAMKNDLPVEQVQMVRCLLDEEDTTDDEDMGVYVRKVAPNVIEYAVGYESDFARDFGGKIYRQTL